MSAGLRVRYFPSTFVLGCCSAVARAAGRCFGSRVCIDARRVRTPVSAREVSIAEECLRDPPTTPTFSFSPFFSLPLQRSPTSLRSLLYLFDQRGYRAVGAKYFDEWKFAVRHAAALACPGARYMPISDAARRQQAGRSASYREPGVIIGLPAPQAVGRDRSPAVGDGRPAAHGTILAKRGPSPSRPGPRTGPSYPGAQV